MHNGRLFLIPTLLGDEPAAQVLPAGTLEVIHRIEHFIVEEIRTARRFLRKAGVTRALEELSFDIFNEHSRNEEFGDYLTPALIGHDIGLLSEAGTPCIADPGSEIVRLAHEQGIKVIPLAGPSSLLLALMASGFNGQNFAFLGYLPVDRSERTRKIREIERTATEKQQTQIFIETPYRNIQLFEALLQACRDETGLCIATDITGIRGFVTTKTIGEWRRWKPEINKRPSVFLLSGM